jgi:hypothetical protein
LDQSGGMADSLAGRVGGVKSRAPQRALLPGQFDLPHLVLPLAMLTRNVSVHYVERELLLCGKGLEALAYMSSRPYGRTNSKSAHTAKYNHKSDAA